MFNENRYDKVKDIYSVPCAIRISGEKAISISGKWALVQFADGAQWYFNRGTHWEKVREEVFANV